MATKILDSLKNLLSGGDFNLEYPFALTVQGCSKPDGIIDQEDAFLEALKSAASDNIEGNHLELKTKTGETILVFQER